MGAQLHRKRQLLQEAGSLIGRLYSKGISHGDLSQEDLLVQKNGKAFAFCFVDNERNKTWGRIPAARNVTKLVQFSIRSGHVLTRSDLRRLFAAYSKAAPPPRFHGEARRKFFSKVMSRSPRRVLYCRVRDSVAWLVLMKVKAAVIMTSKQFLVGRLRRVRSWPVVWSGGVLQG